MIQSILSLSTYGIWTSICGTEEKARGSVLMQAVCRVAHAACLCESSAERGRMMKKWQKFLLMSGMALAVSFAAKADSEAAQVTGLTQTKDDVNAVQISWAADAQASKYLVELSQDNSSWTSQGYTNGTVNEKVITGLNIGSSYYVRVTSVDAAGSPVGAASQAIEVVTAPDCVSMTAVQSKASKTSVSVKLSEVSGANQYFLLDANSGSLVTASANTELTPEGQLTPGKEYIYLVGAARISSAGYTASNVASVRVPCLTVANKIQKKNFVCQPANDMTDSFTFSASTDGSTVDGVEYQWQTPAGKTRKVVSSISTSRVTIDNFIAGKFLKCRVRTFVSLSGDKRAYSAWSDYRYLGVVKSIKGKISGKKNVKVSWAPVSNASSYDVMVSTKPNGGYKKVKTVNAKKKSLILSKVAKKALKFGKTYYVRVVAKAKIGKKTVSSEVSRYSSFRIVKSYRFS